MNTVAKELKTYADNGLRTATDWLALGRQVTDGIAPRSNMTWRGDAVDLFSRDQTHKRPKSARTVAAETSHA